MIIFDSPVGDLSPFLDEISHNLVSLHLVVKLAGCLFLSANQIPKDSEILHGAVKVLEGFWGRDPPSVAKHFDHIFVVLGGAGEEVEFVHRKWRGLVVGVPGVEVRGVRECGRGGPSRELRTVRRGHGSGDVTSNRGAGDGDVDAVFGKGGIKGPSKAFLKRRERVDFGLSHGGGGYIQL